ncbi:hypothetical protein EUA67_02605 [TM7 phylum sp. oral taxon 352]|nr:hypothetical protein EUA68_01795 [TM7 phylum sp. oral taxon 352]TWP21382.1 hypothetical protein EUA67_02605 [TM7 phylum sp. oral taxon 352]
MRYTYNMVKNFISDARFWFLAIVIFGGVFALSPSLSLAILDFTSLRLGLYQMAAAGLLVTSLPLLFTNRQKFLKNRYLIGGFLAFFLAMTIGVFFAEARLRTALYSLSLLFLLAIGLAAAAAYHQLSKNQKHKFIRIGLWSGLVFGILAIIQLIAATFEPTGFGTLCSGCKADVFGFPRINLFAAEPQFLANALLPAFFLSLFQPKSRLAQFSLFFTATAIALTFSRGGFLAIFLAIIIFIAIASIKRLNISFLYKKFPLIIIGIFFGFTLLFLSANIRYSGSPFIAHNTLVSMIDQLSLGRIKIPQKTTVKNQPAPAAKNPSPHNTPNIKPASPEQTFQPAGFVEASANDRLSASDLAIKSWLSSPRTFFFGVGLGNLGSFIQKHLHVSVPTDQTVYIFYILLLSGLGVVGLLPLIITPFIILFFAIKNLRQAKAQFILSLTVALFIHFWFFGSFINTIHCFAIIGIFLYNYPKDYAEKV